MKEIHADIELNGKPFLENIPVFLSEPTPDHTGVLTTWHGYFEIEDQAKVIELRQFMRSGLLIKLTDGRSGEANIAVPPLLPPFIVEFKGNGNLK